MRFDPKAAEDIKPLKDYINSYVKSFVTKMIDTWFAAKAAGKLPEFRKHLENPGACMEEKIKQLIEFNDKHLTDKSNAPSAKEAAEIQRAANEDVGPKAKPRTADKVIFDELNVIFADETTGINAVVAENAAEGIYNMNGQRVMNAQKGLYIVNGKKVVMK